MGDFEKQILEKPLLTIKTMELTGIFDLIKSFNLIDASLDLQLENWNIDNFLLDLPGKWEFSHVVLANNNVVGYMICSKKESTVHIHRLAILKKMQNQGIGSVLLSHLYSVVGSGNVISLKVKKYNMQGIYFYEKNGFKKYGEEDLNYLYNKRL